MRAAFFKGKGTTVGDVVIEDAIRLQTEGPYSHTELVFSDGYSGSSIPGTGVRLASPGTIDFNSTDWDFVDLSGLDETKARQWYVDNAGKGYDYAGDAHFVVGLIHHNPNDDFCSETVALALGFTEGWRFDPNSLYVILTRLMVQVLSDAQNKTN